MIFVIAAMGYPMRSGVSVSTQPYEHVYGMTMRADESS